ncbi:MAG: cobaltochelatase subunit CobN [Actinomycetota bacterium]|nr:cobaltochelatase subunit CobN [Actinomycetota bacterium]
MSDGLMIQQDASDSLEESARKVLGERLLHRGAISKLHDLRARVLDLARRVDESDEIGALLNGFSGGYVESGPSGLITRGRDDVLPTGRNFYSLDPQRVPTKAAWRVGQRLAEALIAKHLDEEGRYPENVAIYWMCTDIMWADGEGMSQIFALLGVEPIWKPNGRLHGFEITPSSELGRPRIDVTIRVSGITRDNFQVCMDVVDDAVQAVAALDEPPEDNYVRKHVLERVLRDKDSAPSEAELRKAARRIFCARPGSYQAGVQLAVYASAWKEEKDLAEIFIKWNGYAYGRGVWGEESFLELAQSLQTVDITFNKVVTDESDLFACCCHFGTHGGLTAAARHFSGREVKGYYGDTRDPQHTEVRDLADEIRRIARAKLLNPKWIEGMKRHGYKGAGDISKRVGRVYGYAASTREVDDWIFDDIAKTFVIDQENREFFEENNPWAMEEIARRLLEAKERGLWDADPDVLDELRSQYLEIEGWIEDRMDGIEGDFQGGATDIVEFDDAEGWGEQIEAIRDVLDARE